MLRAKKSRVSTTFAYRAIAFLLRPLMQMFTRRDWRGAEHLDVPGGIIAVSNHISNFDALTVAHFLHDNGRPPRFLAKQEVFKIPVIGAIIKSAGQIPVRRGTARAAEALIEAEHALARGEAAVIYPEGTLTFDPALWPMTAATGVARLALKSGAPVIPIAQWGAHNVIPHHGKGLRLIPPQTIHILAGPPVDLSDLLDRPHELASVQTATRRIMADLTRLLEELRGEKAPATPWDRRNSGESDGA